MLDKATIFKTSQDNSNYSVNQLNTHALRLWKYGIAMTTKNKNVKRLY